MLSVTLSSRRRKACSSSEMHDCNIDALTDDALLHIFSFLTLLEKGRVASVCKRWDTVVSNPSLWHRIDLRKLIRKTNATTSQSSTFTDWYWTFPRDSSMVHNLLRKYASGSLKHLRINVTVDKELQMLIEDRCAQLDSLEFETDGEDNRNALSFLPSKLKRLYLALSPRTKWRPLSAEFVSPFKHLQIVSLRYVSINYELCTCLIESAHLRVMRLDGCNWQVLPSEFRFVSEHLSELRELYLISCHFPSPSCIYGIIHHVSSKCKHLKKLELNQPFIMGYQRIGLSHRLDGILEAIGNCRSELVSLKLAATVGLTLDGLITVTSLMTNLKELSLVSCVDITNEFMQLINNNLNSLNFLDISGCRRVTDKGLKYLCHHRCLEQLHLYGCSCLSEDAVLMTIKALVEIRIVTLPGWRGYDVCADLLRAQRPKVKVKFW
ncbi:uncharacterized protein [Amphiura filiformis]|uniref:uncharacterized protein n=1 Tax=Amphiura filiformis TaxID=82378 RepID=UPI003B2150EB